jgi:hypothetical protein
LVGKEKAMSKDELISKARLTDEEVKDIARNLDSSKDIWNGRFPVDLVLDAQLRKAIPIAYEQGRKDGEKTERERIFGQLEKHLEYSCDGKDVVIGMPYRKWQALKGEGDGL